MLGSLLTKGSGELNWYISRHDKYGLKQDSLTIIAAVVCKVHFRPQVRVHNPMYQESGVFLEP